MDQLTIPKDGTIELTVLRILVEDRFGKKSRQEIVDEVLKKHPESEITAECVSWYRSKYRRFGFISSAWRRGAKLRLVA